MSEAASRNARRQRGSDVTSYDEANLSMFVLCSGVNIVLAHIGFVLCQMHRALRPQDEVARRVVRNHHNANLKNLRQTEEDFKQRQADRQPRPSFKLKRFRFESQSNRLCVQISHYSKVDMHGNESPF